MGVEGTWGRKLTQGALLSERLAAALPVASQGLLVCVYQHVLGQGLLGRESLAADVACIGLSCICDIILVFSLGMGAIY